MLTRQSRAALRQCFFYIPVYFLPMWVKTEVAVGKSYESASGCLKRRKKNLIQLTETHARFRLKSNKSGCRERDSDRVISLRLMTPLRTAVGAFEEPDYRVALIFCLVFLFLIYCKTTRLTVFSGLANSTHYSQKVQDVIYSGEMFRKCEES